jgi:hypothetical protein
VRTCPLPHRWTSPLPLRRVRRGGHSATFERVASPSPVSLERMRPKPRPWRRGAAVGLKPASPLKKLPALRPTAGLASPEEMDQPGPSRPPARDRVSVAACAIPSLAQNKTPGLRRRHFGRNWHQNVQSCNKTAQAAPIYCVASWDFPEMSLAWSLLPGLAGQLRASLKSDEGMRNVRLLQRLDLLV